MPLSGVMAIAQSESFIPSPDQLKTVLYPGLTELLSGLARFKHITVSDGASDQQRGWQPCSTAAGAVFPAAPQPPPAEPDATVSQPHEPAAVHGYCHTLTQSVTVFYIFICFVAALKSIIYVLKL